jgi:hypothetical protein
MPTDYKQPVRFRSFRNKSVLCLGRLFASQRAVIARQRRPGILMKSMLGAFSLLFGESNTVVTVAVVSIGIGRLFGIPEYPIRHLPRTARPHLRISLPRRHPISQCRADASQHVCNPTTIERGKRPHHGHRQTRASKAADHRKFLTQQPTAQPAPTHVVHPHQRPDRRSPPRAQGGLWRHR